MSRRRHASDSVNEGYSGAGVMTDLENNEKVSQRGSREARDCSMARLSLPRGFRKSMDMHGLHPNAARGMWWPWSVQWQSSRRPGSGGRALRAHRWGDREVNQTIGEEDMRWGHVAASRMGEDRSPALAQRSRDVL